MQNLWSRTAQIRSSCQCSSCLHSTIALGRRTATAGIRRRKVTAGEFITACYSSILATAAIADARVKENRTRDWDQAIADVKAGKSVRNIPEPSMKDQVDKEVTNWDQVIAGLGKESQLENTSEPATKDDGVTDTESNYVRRVGTGKMEGVINRYLYPQHTKANLESLNHKHDTGSASWNHVYNAWNTNKMDMATISETESECTNSESVQVWEGCLEVQSESMEMALWMSKNSVSGRDELREQSSEQIEHRAPRSDVHLRKMEAMIQRLVDQILHRGKLACLKDGTLVAIPRKFHMGEETEEIAKLLIGLRNRFVQSPIYSWKTDEEVSKERSTLHSAMSQLLAKVTPGDQGHIQTTVGKVCYNLLVASAPPNIETYNILIDQLTRLQQHHLAQAVVDSLLDDSKMLLNDNAVKLILDHYTAKRDSHGFRLVIRRMRAVDPEGRDMHVKRKGLWQLAEEKDVQDWAFSPKTKLCHRNGWLSEKYSRSPTIFEALIRGSIVLFKLGDAARTIRAAIREAQTVFPESIHLLIKVTVAVNDYKTAAKLLQGILMYWDDGRTKSILKFNRAVRLDMYQLLSLCGIDPKGDLEPVLHPYLSWDALRGMMEHMKNQAAEDIQRSRNLDSILESDLNDEELAVQQDTLPALNSDEINDRALAGEPPLKSNEFGPDTSLVVKPENTSTSKFNELGCEPVEPGSIQEASYLLRKLVELKTRASIRETTDRWIRINGIEARIEARAKWISSATELIESTIEIIEFHNRFTMKTSIGQVTKTFRFAPSNYPSQLKVTRHTHEKPFKPRSLQTTEELLTKKESKKRQKRKEFKERLRKRETERSMRPKIKEDKEMMKKRKLKDRLTMQEIIDLRRFRYEMAQGDEPTPEKSIGPRADEVMAIKEKESSLALDMETRDKLDSQLSALVRGDGRRKLVAHMVRKRLEVATETLSGQADVIKYKNVVQFKHEQPRMQVRYHAVDGGDGEGLCGKDTKSERDAYLDLMGE